MKQNNISEKTFNVIFLRALSKVPFVDVNKDTVIKPETNLREDLNMDSLDIMEAVIVLENKFNINLYKAESTKINTVNDFYNMFTTEIAEIAHKKRIQNLYHHGKSRPERAVENRELKKHVMSLLTRQYNG